MFVYAINDDDDDDNDESSGWISDKPGKTSAPTVEDVDEDSVKLSWTPPKSDGGDKVRGYVIEAKEKGSDKWKPLNAKSPCKDTKFTGTCFHSFIFHSAACHRSCKQILTITLNVARM